MELKQKIELNPQAEHMMYKIENAFIHKSYSFDSFLKDNYHDMLSNEALEEFQEFCLTHKGYLYNLYKDMENDTDEEVMQKHNISKELLNFLKIEFDIYN